MNSLFDTSFNLKCDPIAYSAVLFRTGNANHVLHSEDTFKCITDDDLRLAGEIRKYYSGKFMTRVLNEKPLSKFRSDLVSFLGREDNTLVDTEIGMLIRLPHFYDYDIRVDSISEKHQVISPSDDLYVTRNYEHTLTPVLKVERKTRHKNIVQYWALNEHKNVVAFDVSRKNPFFPWFDKLFDNGESWNIEGTCSVIPRGNFNFYAAKENSWRLVI